MLGFELTVSDGVRFASDRVEVQVQVSLPEVPRSAVAGEDRTVDAGAVVALDGTSSGGPAERTLAWTQTAGPEVRFVEEAAGVAVFVAPMGQTEATLIFELEARAGDARATDTVTVRVRAAPVAQHEGGGCISVGPVSTGPSGLAFMLLLFLFVLRRSAATTLDKRKVASRQVW